MNSVQARLRYWREERKSLSLRELQDAVNAHLPPDERVSLGTVSNYERDDGTRAGPRAAFLAALKSAFPELRLEWLLLGEGAPSEVDRRVSRLAGQETEEGAEGLAGRVGAAYPDLGLLSPEASALFLAALVRYATAAPDGEPGERAILELAGDLRWLLLLPLRCWGFEHRPGYEGLSAYAVAMLHALMLLMPGPGRGDPLAAADPSTVRRLRETVEVGFGGEVG